jgi:tRNA (guanine-N7-)-methyltransferase
MGHDKLRKFAENETFSCLLQPSASELLADGFFALRDHAVKGRWNETMFDVPRPLVLELGCGKGEYTIDLSRREPSCNYIGVDIKGARLWKGAKYAHEHRLGNVAFLRTRIEFIGAFFAPDEVSQIWLTFSDPQLKSENSRLTSPVFLERYRRFLRPGGIVHLKTDSRFLFEYSLAVARCNGLRVLASTPDLYGTAPEDLFRGGLVQGGAPLLPTADVAALYEVQTFYERMFRAQGYKITYLAFTLDHDGPFRYPTSEEFDPVYWRSVEGPRHFATPPDTV